MAKRRGKSVLEILKKSVGATVPKVEKQGSHLRVPIGHNHLPPPNHLQYVSKDESSSSKQKFCDFWECKNHDQKYLQITLNNMALSIVARVPVSASANV
ncbi:hypothetical protein F511_42691 [Dorcoceras hygrometricum]|uniref:Uncharacterized protein n=1 Tax=Dorcoceras hygrometricum TaxID=472368 RepID=A0A2Z7B7I2_9LAMI|nr:hypothetical protein F511_42691 [Dorcoceras hygrometricum]